MLQKITLRDYLGIYRDNDGLENEMGFILRFVVHNLF